MKIIKIILYQKSLGEPIPRKDIDEMREFQPHFVCFPEYFFVSQNVGNLNQTADNQKLQLKRMNLLSKKLQTVIVGGTMPELSEGKLFNTTFIYNRGEQLGYYRKKNLFLPEKGKITPGKEYKFFSAYGIRFGVLICADVFYDESFLFMKKNNVSVIFSPTFSLKKEESVEDKFKRDRDIYVRGSNLESAPIVKVCGVKSEYKNFLQARSLISNEKKILYRVLPEEEDQQLIIKKEITI